MFALCSDVYWEVNKCHVLEASHRATALHVSSLAAAKMGMACSPSIYEKVHAQPRNHHGQPIGRLPAKRGPQCQIALQTQVLLKRVVPP